MLTDDPGRTGRFGRKGISINFVHDQRTWLQMEEIEKILGKKIIRIETDDLDEMEEVCFLRFVISVWNMTIFFLCIENEESLEMSCRGRQRPLSALIFSGVAFVPPLVYSSRRLGIGLAYMQS